MNESPADLRLYKALKTRDFFPARSVPNSEPNMVHIFSEKVAVKYAFWMSYVLTSRSFNAASMRAIQRLSCETTFAYVNVVGATVA